jgi:hypothetical protein
LMHLFCISDEELAADRAALSPADRATLDALPFTLTAPEPLPAVAPAIPRTDARRLTYTGPWPRKRHYHRCPKCKDHGGNGVELLQATLLGSGAALYSLLVVSLTFNRAVGASSGQRGFDDRYKCNGG